MLSAVFIGIAAFGVPGYLLSRLFCAREDGLERLTTALAAGSIVVGWLLVSVAVLTDTAMGLPSLLLLALGLLAGCALAIWLRRINLRLSLAPGDLGLLVGMVSVALFYLVHYDRDLFQLNCVNRAASLVLGHGHASGDYLLAGNRNVRLGNVALVAPTFVAFNFLGPRLLYAWIGALLFGASAVLGRRLSSHRAAPWLVGGLTSLNPYVLAIPILDENLFAAALTTLALASLSARRVRGPWLGTLIGLLIGVRHIGLLVLPAVLLGLLRRRVARRTWLGFLGALFVVSALWAIHHQRVFGSPLIFESFEEYHRDYPHAFLGIAFGFRGLLNAPFADHLVRTPYNPYPGWGMVLLRLQACFGVLLLALWPIGLWALRRRRLGPWLLVLLGLPVAALVAVLGNLMQPNKLGIILLALPAVTLPMGIGAVRLIEAPRRWVPAFLALALTFLGGGLLLQRLDVPPDVRVYTLEDPVRPEAPAYLAFERASLAGWHLLPDFSFAAQYSPFAPARKLHDLWWDLTHTGGIQPPARPEAPLDPTAPPVRLVFDLHAPPIAGGSFVTTPATPAPPALALASSSGVPQSRRAAPDLVLRIAPDEAHAAALFALPPLSWSRLPAHVGFSWDRAAGRLDIALEFGNLAWFPDLTDTSLLSPGRLERPRFEVALPRGATVRFTEVVADHFSRYYRWWVHTDGQVTVSRQPTVVFTN